MKYFTPETSKKLEEMGLESVCERRYEKSDNAFDQAVNMSSILREEYDENMQPMRRLNTLDICELENAKKLFTKAEEELQDWQRRVGLDWEWSEKQREKTQELLAEVGQPGRTIEEKEDWTKRWEAHHAEVSPHFPKNQPYARFTAPEGENELLSKYVQLPDEERVKYVEDYLKTL